jgi:hypothetical protein
VHAVLHRVAACGIKTLNGQVAAANNSATTRFAFGVFVCSIQDDRYLQCQACLFDRQKCLCRSDFLTVGFSQKARRRSRSQRFSYPGLDRQ